MLNPGSDRLDYGKILVPPEEGFGVDFAVGTSYSLDLDTLTGVCMALGLSGEFDSASIKDKVYVLESLRRIGDRVAVFCESGQIHAPSTPTPLYVLLENIVFPVETRKKAGMAKYPSFHPKFWIIRYINTKGDVLYRVIILSRNLTFDRSWDVCFYLDGRQGKKWNDKNQPICDFLKYLVKCVPSGSYDKKKKKRILELINELPYAAFRLDESDKGIFDDYEFIPNGIRNENGGYYQFDSTELFVDKYGDKISFNEIFILSPFLSRDIIRDFNNRNDENNINAKYTLVTRKDSLRKLKPEDVSNFDTYIIRDEVVDGETSLSEDEQSYMKQDIHAKLFMMCRKHKSDLYIGSLNASHNAVYGNVEFMVKLSGRKKILSTEILKNSIFGKDENDSPFEKIDIKDLECVDASAENDILSSILKQLTHADIHAVAKEKKDGWRIRIEFLEFSHDGVKITISPILKANESRELVSGTEFTKLRAEDLSEFYFITVSKSKEKLCRVFKLPTEGIPTDRDKLVIASIIKDKECFYRYLTYLLGENHTLGIIEHNMHSEAKNGIRHSRTRHTQALYEKMLRTASLSPEKFSEVEYLLKSISEDIDAEDGEIADFKKMYEIFSRAVKKHEGS